MKIFVSLFDGLLHRVDLRLAQNTVSLHAGDHLELVFKDVVVGLLSLLELRLDLRLHLLLLSDELFHFLYFPIAAVRLIFDA